ncbi:MAG: acyl-CoA dehydrogenase family protein [candidate division WOR-3 bacterium]|nr:MAG: acyl-CoA dehydrogenase family protein [candidate division WOR-3 bacterium]
MKLSQECTLLQSELKKFAQQVLAEKVDEIEKSCSLPTDNIKRLAEMGIVGAIIPEDLGGAALDTIGLAVVLEEISKVCASTGFVIAVHNAFFAYPILKFGSEEMKKKYLPRAASGEIVGGYALSKTAELRRDTSLDGKNPFVLNAAANGPVVTAVPTEGSNAMSLYVIDPDASGRKFVKTSNTIGLKSAGIGEFNFDKLQLAPTQLIGKEGDGQTIIGNMNSFGRILLAAISLGIAQGATEAAIKYSKERIQFGQPIANFEMVRELIADMKVSIEATRHLVYEAALRADHGEEYAAAAAAAKLLAGQSATTVTTNAIQVYGGYGYMKDYPAERYFRDAQMLNVVCSTPDEDKEIIAKSII